MLVRKVANGLFPSVKDFDMTPNTVTTGFSSPAARNQGIKNHTQAAGSQNRVAGTDVFEKSTRTQASVNFLGSFGPYAEPFTNQQLNDLGAQVPATKGMASMFSVSSGNPAPNDKHFYAATADQVQIVDDAHLDIREGEEAQAEAPNNAQIQLRSQIKIDDAQEKLEMLAETAQNKSPTAADAHH
jgi:hypothetical protein